MQKQVVVVGAGFAGIGATRELAKNKNLKITLIDRRNFHLFQPLLYQVATAGLSPAEIATPIRNLFSKNTNVTVLMDEVLAIHPGKNGLALQGGNLNYDFLLLACGASHSYFGHPEWEEFAPGLKTLEQATEIRRRILTAFEEAEKNQMQQESWLTFVIIGGGPTGVELAGAIRELAAHTVAQDFRNIDPKKSRVVLIEAGDRLLSAFDHTLSQTALNDLERLGVSVLLKTKVTNLDHEQVRAHTGENTIFISTRTIIWAAGVTPSKTSESFSERDPMGRVKVQSDLSVKNFSNVFVVGDQAHCVGENGRPLPGLAPVAMQQGRAAAKNIIRLSQGKTTLDFQYLDKGMMATIGRKRAVMQFKSIRCSGLIAWLGWLLIHIYYLIGFKNRLFVFLQWTWSYFTFSRGARLISEKNWKK